MRNLLFQPPTLIPPAKSKAPAGKTPVEATIATLHDDKKIMTPFGIEEQGHTSQALLRKTREAGGSDTLVRRR